MVQQLRDQLHRTREGLIKHAGASDVHGSIQERDSGRGLQGSIMEARLHDIRDGTGSGGHRERDRLKLLEKRKEESGSDESLTAEERRKQVRKQREAYFRLRDQKHSKTPNTLVKGVVDTSKKTTEDQLQPGSNTKSDLDAQHKKVVLDKRKGETSASVKHSESTHTQKNECTISKSGEQLPMVEKKNETKLKSRKQPSTPSHHQTTEQGSQVSKRTQTTSLPVHSSLQQNFNIKDGANAAGTYNLLYMNKHMQIDYIKSIHACACTYPTNWRLKMSVKTQLYVRV